MTFSITARCEHTGELGVAVATAWFAVGSVCPAVRADIGAVASQALVNANLRAACLDRIVLGLRPELALAEALKMDASPEHRQLGVVDAAGRAAAHTGAACPDDSGHRIDRGCVIAGNTLSSIEVLDAMQSSWNEARGCDVPLAERMLMALDAGQLAGGDARGRQSAATPSPSRSYVGSWRCFVRGMSRSIALCRPRRARVRRPGSLAPRSRGAAAPPPHCLLAAASPCQAAGDGRDHVTECHTPPRSAPRSPGRQQT
jgi:hypothetical protein